ncbi:NAD-dependent protein deacetylase sirtuin-1 [Gadus macrocephalus]|uniref:NAD-dependent protein deacetylase sirtuin-1 n=1 Tax=Gadus macrocephalus TaxID=80720 RepID=UPI0028CB7A85|nr:NAD-dependent protein deacetylase sirtuin-1 [Gadus macrocephalus]
MADGENILGSACASAADTEEPAAKKSKINMISNYGFKVAETEHISCVLEATGSWEAMVNSVQQQPPPPAEKEVEPVMAVEQAPVALGGDNGVALLILEPDKTDVKPDENHALGIVAETPDVLGLPSNGLGDSPEDDDRSSHASSSDWTPQPQIGSYSFIQQHIMRETDPRTILKDLLPETTLPPDLDDMTLWQIIINISEPPKRKKRKDINTLEDVARLLHESKRILVLTGAGVSVSCGIPDFRSRDGIYARLAVDFPDLPDPQSMFDIEYFRRDPRPFFKFAKEIYPGQFQPSPCHKFISMLDKKEKLLRNYTQNIDTLEQVAGVQRIIQCHGSFATASCLVCKHSVDCEAIREDIFNQVVPRCPHCADIPLAIMKPDIVFFGENLPELFHRAMKQDKDEVDLLIVIGSSLKVRPVALIPNSIPHDVPQILINREQLPHLNFDVELLGDCDVIVNELCHRLGGDFEQLCDQTLRLSEITEKPPRLPDDAAVETVTTTTTTSEPDKTPQEETARGAAPAPPTPSEETAGGTVAEASVPAADHAPPEPCPAAAEQPLQNAAAATTAESPEDPTEDTPKEEEAEPRRRRSNLDLRRRCWMSRLGRSPISKRLETCQYLFQAPNHYIFHGAEVYSDSEDESSSSCDSDSEESSCSRDDPEEDSTGTEDDADAAAATPAPGDQPGLRDTITHYTLASEGTAKAQTDNACESNIQSSTHLEV